MLGMSPMQWVRRERIRAFRLLADSRRNVAEVAEAALGRPRRFTPWISQLTRSLQNRGCSLLAFYRGSELFSHKGAHVHAKRAVRWGISSRVGTSSWTPRGFESRGRHVT